MDSKKKSSASGFVAAGFFGALLGVAGTLIAKALSDDDKPKNETPVSQPVQAVNTQNSNTTADQNENIFCPILQEPMTDPYFIKNCGHSFQKSAIKECIEKKKECPVCRVPCTELDLVPNYTLKNIVQDLMRQQK